MKVQDKRNIRRKSAIKRLEYQLKVGTKFEEGKKVSLTDKDKERINMEISILKTRILN